MKVVIIGGVAGGASAAARLRRLDEKAQIIVLEKTGYISYANCGLPYYVGGVITDKKALTLQTPQSFASRFNIDARVNSEVLSIDRKAKQVSVKNLANGEIYNESYDKLIIATGAKAVVPPIKGIDGEGVFVLKTVEDALAVKEYAVSRNAKSALVIGGGFIGLETAENLMNSGMAVTLAEAAPQILASLDADMIPMVQSHIRSKGLDLRVATSVAEIDRKDGITAVLSDGERIAVDLIVCASGVVPDTELAKSAGLETGIRGAIKTDGRMQTSDPDIYAAGDAVEVKNIVSCEQTLIPLAGPANKQGRIVADNICGIDSVYQGSQGSSVIKLFDMTVASTGLNEKALKASGIEFDKVVNFSANHATYYPNFANMTVKTLFAPSTGKVLGAQIVGFEGVDKRADLMATAVRFGLTTKHLTELELCYAPPFSSAKDPVNMAGFAAENVRKGLVKQYHVSDIPSVAADKNAVMLDVRTDAEYAAGHIPNTVHIPLDSLRNFVGDFDKSKTYYVNCQSGLRSYIACRILSGNGIDCYNLSGGYRFYAINGGNVSFDSAPAYPCGIKA